jgi:hypothetical protein
LTTPSHKILQMMAAVLSAMGLAQATPLRAERPPLSKLIGQLRQDAAFRARFSLNPRSVFEERGIDPTPYDLPDRLDGDDIDRFLSNWTGASGPAAGLRATDAVTLMSEARLESLPVLANAHPEKLASESPAASLGDLQASRGAAKIAPSSPPVAPVYEPLPGLPDFLVRKPAGPALPPSAGSQPSDRRASGDEEKMPQQVPAPVAPVYGPPPGLRNNPPDPVPVLPPSPAIPPDEPQAPSDARRPPHRHAPGDAKQTPPKATPSWLSHTPVYGPPPGYRTKP